LLFIERKSDFSFNHANRQNGRKKFRARREGDKPMGMNYAKATKAAGCVLATVVMVAANALSAETADYVFRNGKVYTLDTKQPWAESVAVKGNKIAYVGSNDGAKEWTGPETKVVDLKGQMLMPGFIDAHTHFVSGAIGKRGVALVGSKDKQEMLQRIRDYVKANPQKTLYMGFGWEFLMFGENWGTRQELDAICSDKPMVFFNEDTHNTWFNTKAMEVAGITKDTPDPVPGNSYFPREADGTLRGIGIEPESWLPMAAKTGVFGGKEMLREVANDVFPLVSQSGITACHDMGIWAPDMPKAYLGFEMLLDLEKEGKLPFRVVGVYANRDAKVSPEEGIKTLKQWSTRYHSELVQVTGIKLWADGTYLSHTSVQIEPYADKPETSGTSDWNGELLTRWVEAAYAAGFDVNIHCEGDLSARRGLDAVEKVAKKLYPSARLTTLHHLTLVHPNDVPRFKALGVCANMTPAWLGDYKDQYTKDAIRILGKERVDKEFEPAKPLIESGANVSFGCDFGATDVEELFPLYQIQAAVTGHVPGTTPAYVVPERLRPSLEQVIYGYTVAGARQMRLADKIGSLEVGKFADLVVLEKNLFKIPASEINATKVKLTMMNGKITYQE
jgi:predicted amidohydrolase YtcJ